jgi:hypothetical protein
MTEINDCLIGTRVNLRECVHKEILLGRWIFEDENGLRFEVCKKCWRKFRLLKGFRIIEHGGSIHRNVKK